jgi:hypothetical protein
MGAKVLSRVGTMRFAGSKRKLLALALLAVFAALAWYTMDTGRIRLLVMVLLGGFALRIALTVRTKSDDETAEDAH